MSLSVLPDSPFLYRSDWLLGDAFMKNAYVVFDVATESVGFAELS